MDVRRMQIDGLGSGARFDDYTVTMTKTTQRRRGK